MHLMLAIVHAVRTPVIEVIGAGVAGIGAAGLGNKVIMLARRNYLQFIIIVYWYIILYK